MKHSLRSTLLVAPLLMAIGATIQPAACGNFLVSSSGSNQVLSYSDAGTFLGVFASGGGLNKPQGLMFNTGGDLLAHVWGEAA